MIRMSAQHVLQPRLHLGQRRLPGPDAETGFIDENHGQANLRVGVVGIELEAGRLVELLPDYRAGELDIHALYPSRRHIAPKLRLMIDYLANAMESSDWAV